MMKKGEAQMEPRDLNADIEQVLRPAPQRSRGAQRHRRHATRSRVCRRCSGDHIQLQQVLLNLSSMAATPCTRRPPDERRLVIATERDGADDMVHVSVTDRGAGIAPGMLERIFEPFYSTKDNGLGMGLAICRAIIKAHGGLLWAENNPGRGATFHFTLRLGERKPA